MNVNSDVFIREMIQGDERIGQSAVKKHNLLSSLALDLDSRPSVLLPKPRMSELMNEGHRSVRSFGSTRLLPSIHPSPGRMPGSRKRRVNASNGPNSLSQATPERLSPSLAHVTPDLDRKTPFNTNFAETSPMSTDFARTSPASPPEQSTYFDATPPIRNTMLNLTMTPPRLPVQTADLGLAAPATPEISTFKNLSLRSPIFSNSPGSCFSHHPNKGTGFASPIGQLTPPGFPSSSSPGQRGRLSSPIFPLSPSLRQVRLKVLSNCTSSPQRVATQNIPEEEVLKTCPDSPRIVKHSEFLNKSFTSVPSPRMASPTSHLGYSPQESRPPTLMFSSRVSPNDSYARHTDNRETIDQELNQPWPALNNGQLINESARPPLTPPLLSRYPTKQSTIKKFPAFPAHDAKDRLETVMGDEMSALLHGFLPERHNIPENPGTDVSERARNHIPRNINFTKKLRIKHPMKRQDSMTFSDDEGMNENTEGHEPPIHMLSLGQQMARKKPNSKGNALKYHKSPQKSLISPGLHLSDDALDIMLHDASGTDGNDTVGSLSDDDECSNSFFLTSPKRCFDEATLQVKGTERLDSHLPPQDYGVLSSNRIESRQKKKRISPSEDDDWILSNKVEMNQGHYQGHNENMLSLSGSMSDADRESSKNDKLRRQTSFSNMDVIRENSVSNASLVGMLYLPNESTSRSRISIRSCSGSSKSSSDESSRFDRPNSLRRNQSDQSLNSIGLCLEGVPLYSESNSRDMVTPPVIRNDSLTPPPIKKIRLGTAIPY